MYLFAATVFTSAFLLFLVQPIIAKQILPWFGGNASVWTVCMVFFQLVLLGGYAYSDALVRKCAPRVQARRLQPDIVRIMPQYRDYDYTVIDNRVAIVDPRRREVVEILDDGPGYGGMAAYGRDRIVISDDTRTRFRELVRSSSTTVGSTSPSGGGTSASNCLSLQPVPEELARTHPELSSYRYLAIGDQVVLVDPQQQKIVQVID